MKMKFEDLILEYEEYQRNIAKMNHRNELKEGGFFGRFQYEKQEECVPSASSEVQIFDHYVTSKKEEIHAYFSKVDHKIAYHRFLLNHERQMSVLNSVSTHYTSNEVTRYHVDAIEELKKKKTRLVNEDPIAWLSYYEHVLQQDLYNMEKKRMVEVPYVKDAKHKIIDALQGGTPVYLVGHLGSGKTQLAVEAAVDFTIENRMQQQLEKKMEEWFLDHQDASDEDAFYEFCKQYDRVKIYYDELLEHGSQKELEVIQPLFISGSHNLTYEDMFVEKTLTLSKGFEEGNATDYLDAIAERYQQWMDEHQDLLESMNEKEKLQLQTQIWKTFSDLMVAKNSSFGTTVEKIEREILIAIKEGRPVIIDELNTIAMQNLIALNDILQHRAGSKAYVTGVGPVTIQPGFALIGTGNLSTDTVNYEGTNALNPAFQSRFITVEYNYVRENMIGSLKEETNMEENELFRLMIEYLLEEDGTLFLPDLEHSVEEIFHFASLASLSQQVFMGHWNENARIDLKEAVLSIRNILHVLDHYNHGEQEDLSMALWNGFLSSITNGVEQNYLLNQAVRFGFFAKDDGWKIQPLGAQANPVTLDEIRTQPYHYIRKPMDCYSRIDVVHLLFGSGVGFERVPEELQEICSLESECPIQVETIQNTILSIRKSSHGLDILDFIKDQIELTSDQKQLSDEYRNLLDELTHKITSLQQQKQVDEETTMQLKKLQMIEDQLFTSLLDQMILLEPFYTSIRFQQHPYDVLNRNDRLVLPSHLEKQALALYEKRQWFKKARREHFNAYAMIHQIEYIASKDGLLQSYKDGNLLHEIQLDDKITSLSYDDEKLYVGTFHGKIYELDLGLQQETLLLDTKMEITQIACNTYFIAVIDDYDRFYLFEKKQTGYQQIYQKPQEVIIEQIVAFSNTDFLYYDLKHRMYQVCLDRCLTKENLWEKAMY